MSVFYTEADYENSIIELFQNMGYRHEYGPDIERDFYDPLHEVELQAALYRLNPGMPEDAIADALFKLKNFENASLVQKNEVFMDYLQHGIEVRYFVKGEERAGLVYLVDYSNPDNNNDSATIKVEKVPDNPVTPPATMHPTGNPILMVVLSLLAMVGVTLRRKL